jgi:hypothetical protein
MKPVRVVCEVCCSYILDAEYVMVSQKERVKARLDMAMCGCRGPIRCDDGYTEVPDTCEYQAEMAVCQC